MRTDTERLDEATPAAMPIRHAAPSRPSACGSTPVPGYSTSARSTPVLSLARRSANRISRGATRSPAWHCSMRTTAHTAKTWTARSSSWSAGMPVSGWACSMRGQQPCLAPRRWPRSLATPACPTGSKAAASGCRASGASLAMSSSVSLEVCLNVRPAHAVDSTKLHELQNQNTCRNRSDDWQPLCLVLKKVAPLIQRRRRSGRPVSLVGSKQTVSIV